MGTILEDQNIFSDFKQHSKTFPVEKSLPGLEARGKHEQVYDPNNIYAPGTDRKNSENWALANDTLNIVNNTGTEDDPEGLRPINRNFEAEGRRAGKGEDTEDE
jgi:hypothetical protein